MWHDMFSQQIPLLEKVLRTILIYALIAFLLRVTGKRGLSGLNSLDIVVMVLLSNVVQNAIIGPDDSVTGGAIGAVTLIAVNSLLNRAAVHNDTLGRVLDGSDTTVIRDGEADQRLVRRLGLRRKELDHAVRLQNADSIEQVKHGVLTPDGQFVISLKEAEQSATKADVAALRTQLDDILRHLKTTE